MRIAIDVNDATIAEKILQFLQNFKSDVIVTQKENTPSFQEQKESLQKIYDQTMQSDFTAVEIDEKFWNEMDTIISNAQ